MHTGLANNTQHALCSTKAQALKYLLVEKAFVLPLLILSPSPHSFPLPPSPCSLGMYAANQGVIYCKSHFKQLFKVKGNYDEGLGRQQHKTKWQKESPSPEPRAAHAHSEHHHSNTSFHFHPFSPLEGLSLVLICETQLLLCVLLTCFIGSFCLYFNC